MERKLTAILSADVKGYSRLMGDNEEATIRTLTAYRAVMTTLIQQHRGRVVDSPGDNLLAEFASAVDAVQGAVEIQQTLRERNTELPAERKMEYRIGINVGDVIVEGERLYGDGVNTRLGGLLAIVRARREILVKNQPFERGFIGRGAENCSADSGIYR